ncbi:MAG: NB-ARC domain-containing protein [Chitinophagales bacterium]
MAPNFADETKLLIRLKSAFDKKQKFTFLVGSGLTCSNLSKGELGVGSVSEIVEDIRKIFIQNNQEGLFDSEITNSDNGNQYQKAVRLLLDCFGQDEANKVIFRSVLKARSNKTKLNTKDDEVGPSILEQDVDNWYLRKGVDALGEIFVDFNDSFSGPILTSNFDPLIEIGIRKHNGTPQSVFLVNDGKFSNSISHAVHQVLHFHGYWTGDDTLHTIDQLTRPRPQLKGDLRKLLANNLLVVSAYGGWDDVFTNTLLELISEGGNNFNVLWTFYESDEKEIAKKHSRLLEKLSPSIGQRVILYKGIDCQNFFPKLLENFNANKVLGEPSSAPIAKSADTNHDIAVVQTDFSIKTKSIFTCDTPPNNSIWVGRKKEIGDVLNSDYKTCFITGIGGQGKSGLASHIVKFILSEKHQYEYWDWRDCKEEDNRIHTIVTSIIERLTNGDVRAVNLLSESTETVIELFFELLGNRKIFFVFDNVDKYIDYEKFSPERGIGKIFDLANSKSHNSKFIFTCRPNIHVTNASFQQIKLGPLDVEETIELFKQSKANLNSEQLIQIAKESHIVTEGHPLWLHLICAQSKSGYAIVSTFLQDIKAHKLSSTDKQFYAQVDNTLNVVWKSLNYKQQTLLRGLAESVTALTEDEISLVLGSELSANQCRKSLRKLMSLNLLVIKSSEDSSDLYELHPLVKEFILNKFQRNERSKFIALFVNFYDSLIVVIKPKLNADSPLSYFQKWTNKIELQINKGDYQEALLSLQEISSSILSAGFVDEYLRVSIRLFVEMDWLKAITEEFPYFHDQVDSFIHTLVDYGRFIDADAYLHKYVKNISSKGNHYIGYCNSKAYLHWYKEEYTTAIEWSEQGIKLLKNPELNSNKDITHNLALALRDTREKSSLERALKIFLKEEALDEIINPDVVNSNFGGSYYGNIGRCLWYMQKIDDSLICYVKAVRLLSEEQLSNTRLNLGWGYLWLGEAFDFKGQFERAFYFYKRCYLYWEKIAPVKAKLAEVKIKHLLDSGKITQEIFSSSEIKVDNYCSEYLSVQSQR